MDDPFRIPEPFVASVSGGRTSGRMLRGILDAYGGKLPANGRAVFCNTGKERPETLDFVERMSAEWDVPITWLEYRHTKGVGPSFVEVNYATASRDGEPLEAAITGPRGDSGFLPNPVVRYCTIETKILTAIRWIDATLGWESWSNAVGFRADEPQRVAKLRAAVREEREDAVAPLMAAGIGKADVLTWWKRQPFDLKLLPHESNCDLCFLKSKGALLEIMSRNPGMADWWVRQESRGGRFRSKRPPYRVLAEIAKRPGLFDATEPGELDVACHCTD